MMTDLGEGLVQSEYEMQLCTYGGNVLCSWASYCCFVFVFGACGSRQRGIPLALSWLMFALHFAWR